MSQQLRSTSRQRGQRSNRRSQTFQRTQRAQRPAFKSQGSRRSTGGSNILTSSYSGGIEELKGHYYDCSSYKQADKFVTTTKAIKEYVGKNYSNGGDIRATLESMTEFPIEYPEDPSDDYVDMLDPHSNRHGTSPIPREEGI